MNIVDFFFDIFRRFRIFRFFRRRLYKDPLRKKDEVDFFDFPQKCIGPGASEKPFGPSGGVREAFLAVPGGLGAVLGGSWAVLERSWEVLGRSGGVLGPSWADLGMS